MEHWLDGFESNTEEFFKTSREYISDIDKSLDAEHNPKIQEQEIILNTLLEKYDAQSYDTIYNNHPDALLLDSLKTQKERFKNFLFNSSIIYEYAHVESTLSNMCLIAQSVNPQLQSLGSFRKKHDNEPILATYANYIFNVIGGENTAIQATLISAKHIKCLIGIRNLIAHNFEVEITDAQYFADAKAAFARGELVFNKIKPLNPKIVDCPNEVKALIYIDHNFADGRIKGTKELADFYSNSCYALLKEIIAYTRLKVIIPL